MHPVLAWTHRLHRRNTPIKIFDLNLALVCSEQGPTMTSLPPLGYVQWQRATVCPRGVAWPMVRGYRRPLHSDRVNERQSYTRIIRLASRITGERRNAKALKKGDTV